MHCRFGLGLALLGFTAACGSRTIAADALPETADGASLDGGSEAGDAVSVPSDAASEDAGAALDAGNDGAAAAGTYSAYYVAGGLDRVFVVKSDPARKICFQVVLTTPGTNSSDASVPANWALESARARDEEGACAKSYSGAAATADSTAQTGSVTFAASPAIPTSIASFAVTLAFAGGPSWAPASEVLSVSDLPVE